MEFITEMAVLKINKKKPQQNETKHRPSAQYAPLLSVHSIQRLLTTKYTTYLNIYIEICIFCLFDLMALSDTHLMDFCLMPIY